MSGWVFIAFAFAFAFWAPLESYERWRECGCASEFEFEVFGARNGVRCDFRRVCMMDVPTRVAEMFVSFDWWGAFIRRIAEKKEGEGGGGIYFNTSSFHGTYDMSPGLVFWPRRAALWYSILLLNDGSEFVSLLTSRVKVRLQALFSLFIVLIGWPWFSPRH